MQFSPTSPQLTDAKLAEMFMHVISLCQEIRRETLESQINESVVKRFLAYEGCSNMNASSFITFFTYKLRQNGKRYYKGLYVTFKLAPDLKKYTVYLSSYSPLNKGHVSILTNSML